MNVWLHVIGVGEDGVLSPAALALIDRASLVVGGERHLAMVPQAKAEKKVWGKPLAKTLDEICARRGTPVVVLATGDPMNYGVGATLARRVPAGEMAVHPHLSAFQLAAARLVWPLVEVECLSIHGRPAEVLAGAVAPGRKLLLLSNDGDSPAQVARGLAALGYGGSTVTVLEHLGGVSERIYAGRAGAWTYPRAADLNTLAVECVARGDAQVLSLSTGLSDDAFQHDGQMTKREVRTATLSALRPLPGQLLWDVGAGCGSIAIEWLRTHRSLLAIAIEADPTRQGLIAANAAQLGTPHLTLVKGAAPAAFAGLPDPDTVFVGGGMGDPGVIDEVWARLKPGGRFVANAVTAEGEAQLFALYNKVGGQMARLSVARLSPVGGLHGWKPMMPVTQFWVDKT